MSFCVSDILPGQERGVGGGRGSFSKAHADDLNTAEYLSWRRLHLSKSKLNNVAEMASFMAGFAVVATVELQINDQDANPPLLTAFVITTALLVGTCMTAIIIATCVLPHLEAVARTSNISDANQSPHDKMMRLIDISWILTNSASLFFFTLDIILMSWIKYTYFSRGASIAATVIMGPVLVVIVVFAFVFYRRIVKHQYVISSLKYEELEQMHKQLERTASLGTMSYQGSMNQPSNYHSVTSGNNSQWLQQNHPHYSQIPPAHSSHQSLYQNPSPPQRHNTRFSQVSSPLAHGSQQSIHQNPPPSQRISHTSQIPPPPATSSQQSIHQNQSPPQRHGHRSHSHRHHRHKHSHRQNQSLRNHNNNNLPRSPIYFSGNPNGRTRSVDVDDSPGVNSPRASEAPSPTTPLSPSWSENSFSPSVFTV